MPCFWNELEQGENYPSIVFYIYYLSKACFYRWGTVKKNPIRIFFPFSYYRLFVIPASYKMFIETGFSKKSPIFLTTRLFQTKLFHRFIVKFLSTMSSVNINEIFNNHKTMKLKLIKVEKRSLKGRLGKVWLGFWAKVIYRYLRIRISTWCWIENWCQ